MCNWEKQTNEKELGLHPSAIIFINVFSFSTELDPEALKMCIFSRKKLVKGAIC